MVLGAITQAILSGAIDARTIPYTMMKSGEGTSHEKIGLIFQTYCLQIISFNSYGNFPASYELFFLSATPANIE